MTPERMMDIAKRLQEIDPDLYDGVMEMLQEERHIAVEEFKRTLYPQPWQKSPFDKRK